MAVRDINTLKQWFKTAAKPVESQFADWLDSFRHKSEKIEASDLADDIKEVLNSSISQAQYTALMSAIAAGAKLYRYKQAENPKPNVGNDNTIYIEATTRPFAWEIWHNGAYYPVFNDVVTVPLLTDLNSLYKPGQYFFWDVLNDYPNSPPGVVSEDTFGAVLTVTAVGEIVFQELTCNYVGADTTAVFVRTFVDTVWTDWVRLLDTSLISDTNISNWNAAYNWGNHAGLYEAKKKAVITSGSAFTIDPEHTIVLINAAETTELYLPTIAAVGVNKIYEFGFVGRLDGHSYLNHMATLFAVGADLFHHPLDTADKQRLTIRANNSTYSVISTKIISTASGWAVLQAGDNAFDY